MTDDVSDLLHAQYRLSLVHWNAGVARRRPTAGHSHVRCLQRSAAPGGTRPCPTHLGPVQHVLGRGGPGHLAQQGRVPARRDPVPHHRGVHEQDRGALQLWSSAVTYADRPPAGAPKTVTFCSVDLHNVVAKKRDAAISHLQRLHAHMKLFDVDLVGGDFNMAEKGPAADVFSDAEFMAPGSSLLKEAGGREGDNVDCTGFLCMPRRPFHWFVNKHGVHTFSNDKLGLDERDESTHNPVFMHLWATYLPSGTRVVLRSDAAQSRRLLMATTKNERKRQRRRV